MTDRANTGTGATDATLEQLTAFVASLQYQDLPASTIHAAKARVIDTLGALMGGMQGEPCMIARKLAVATSDTGDASLIGTDLKSSPETAAFVNGVTARYAEANDVYDRAGSRNGHPSDVITPLLAVAESAHASGRDFLVAVVAAYEIYLLLCDVFRNLGFDHTTFGGIATAAAAGRLLGLRERQLSNCISTAVVSNNILRQVRAESSMWKVTAAGQSGRAGVSAALLAQAGMTAPTSPFSGVAGWCDHVALTDLQSATLGDARRGFRIEQTMIKLRPSSVHTIPAILATERLDAPGDAASIESIRVETYKYAKDAVGTGAKRWRPQSREAADHSIPYVVAATLIDGTVTVRSFEESRLQNALLQSLMDKVQVIENAEYTAAHASSPTQYRTAVIVTRCNGERSTGEWTSDSSAAADHRSAIDSKFLGFAEPLIGKTRARQACDVLWKLDSLPDVSVVPPLFSASGPGAPSASDRGV